jgi:LmbE family N-acetylglucosaminyl deacetylase
MSKQVLSCTTDYQKKNAILVISHCDDEIIFFLPFLNHFDKVIIASLPATSAHTNIVNKYSRCYDANWYFARGITSYQTYIEYWLNQEKRQESITDYSYDVALRDLIADPDVHEIWTHSPHGEYSHHHHKQVSKIVRKLAVEYNKDVWCPNIVCTLSDTNYFYESLTLPYYNKRNGWFSEELYMKLQNYFLEEFVNQTFPINYWTWQKGFPYSEIGLQQEYFLAVSNGIDYTLEDEEIKYVISNLPTYGI